MHLETHSNQDIDKLKTMLQKASRVDVVIITDSEADKAKIDAAKEQQTTGKQIEVVLNGTSPYKHYDIKNDMLRLKQLSDDLANAQSSNTIRVINLKASEISENGLFFDDDGRYIVLNIEMDTKNGSEVSFAHPVDYDSEDTILITNTEKKQEGN